MAELCNGLLDWCYARHFVRLVNGVQRGTWSVFIIPETHGQKGSRRRMRV
jgi:hypothetical protein